MYYVYALYAFQYKTYNVSSIPVYMFGGVIVEAEVWHLRSTSVQ